MFVYEKINYFLWVKIPSVDHLVALLQPADPWHLAAGRSSIHVDDEIVFSHKHLQTAHHIPAEEDTRGFQWGSFGTLRIQNNASLQKYLHN